MRVIFCIIYICLVASCKEIKPQEKSAYFSIEDLLDDQIDLLVRNRSQLEKMGIANGDTANSAFTPDSLQWANEFQVIRDLNINKPALVGRYNVAEENDTHSNLKVIRYRAKEVDLQIRQFDIFYLNEPTNIKFIKAQGRNSNSIFESEKKIVLEFDNINETLQLKNFSIEGFQKMVLQDSVLFDTRGKIIN